ncbi:MAG TPA: hypothetical protein VJI32_03570 [Candidatus Nanoarchaeia archaeon]|nr:hypothetical protein [Candidatus Nanoarchaeia archaeon]
MKNKIIYISIAVILLAGLSFFGWQKYEELKREESRRTQPTISISQKDKNRVKQITTGVKDGTILVTTELQQGLKAFFKKYHMSEDDVSYSRLVGFGFREAPYDVLFFEDAIASLKEEVPVKSEYRAYLGPMSHLNPNTLQLTIFPREKFQYSDSPRELLMFPLYKQSNN